MERTAEENYVHKVVDDNISPLRTKVEEMFEKLEEIEEYLNQSNDKPINNDIIYNKAIKFVRDKCCDVHLGTHYMLLGDVAELIKITTGKEVDWKIFSFYIKSKY